MIRMLLEDMLPDLVYRGPRPAREALQAASSAECDVAMLDVNLKARAARRSRMRWRARRSVRVLHRLRRAGPAGSVPRPATLESRST